MTGNPDTKSPTHRIATLVKSFSQDIIYAVTGGRNKPPKHLLLPYAVKTLTGNIEIIGILNRFGHGVSYSQLEENDTALCLQKLAISPTQRVAIPASIQPNVFVNLAWDNIDRLEETLTGKGTSHRVNGIVVQAKKNLVWILARQKDQEHQAIPSWTGFNIQTRDQVSISEDVVDYLPTINAPATELSKKLLK